MGSRLRGNDEWLSRERMAFAGTANGFLGNGEWLSRERRMAFSGATNGFRGSGEIASRERRDGVAGTTQLVSSLQPQGSRRYGGGGRGPDLAEAAAHGEAFGLVAEAERAAEEVRHGPAHVVAGVEHEEGVLQLPDGLVGAVHLDRMRVAREQAHHARALAHEIGRASCRERE